MRRFFCPDHLLRFASGGWRKKIFPKWWFHGDFPWYKVKHRRKAVNKQEFRSWKIAIFDNIWLNTNQTASILNSEIVTSSSFMIHSSAMFVKICRFSPPPIYKRFNKKPGRKRLFHRVAPSWFLRIALWERPAHQGRDQP